MSNLAGGGRGGVWGEGGWGTGRGQPWTPIRLTKFFDEWQTECFHTKMVAQVSADAHEIISSLYFDEV